MARGLEWRMDAGARPIRVLVAEDNHDLCMAICALIAAECDMQVAGTVDSTRHLVDATVRSGSHVLVLDLNLGGESSVPALLQLRRSHPRLAVVIYSGHDPRDLGDIFTPTDRCEYVAKTGDPDELIGAIRRTADGAASASA